MLLIRKLKRWGEPENYCNSWPFNDSTQATREFIYLWIIHHCNQLPASRLSMYLFLLTPTIFLLSVPVSSSFFFPIFIFFSDRSDWPSRRTSCAPNGTKISASWSSRITWPAGVWTTLKPNMPHFKPVSELTQNEIQMFDLLIVNFTGNSTFEINVSKSCVWRETRSVSIGFIDTFPHWKEPLPLPPPPSIRGQAVTWRTSIRWCDAIFWFTLSINTLKVDLWFFKKLAIKSVACLQDFWKSGRFDEACKTRRLCAACSKTEMPPFDLLIDWFYFYSHRRTAIGAVRCQGSFRGDCTCQVS